MNLASAKNKIRLLTFIALVCFFLTATGQPQIMPSDNNGIYANLWRYKRDKLQNTAYIGIVFLNDSIFLYTMNSSYKKTRFNTTRSGASQVGRKILYRGEKKWFVIRDNANIGYPISFYDFTDTTGRMDFTSAINFDWQQAKVATQPSKNPYEIYEVHFYEDSLWVNSFRTFQPDNGDLGRHNKIEESIDDFFTLDSMDINNICDNCFLQAKIKNKCIPRFIPIPENISGNNTPYRFAANEEVLVSKNTYLKYSFVIKLDTMHKVIKYGWILRNYLTK